MIKLAQHIEILLLENDCVILPGFGGFVAHYTPSTLAKEDNRFLPPARRIGFNPQLKLNDGVLIQSYMSMYDTSFADANRLVENEICELIKCLHENGKIDLENIGELRYGLNEIFEFVPYDFKYTTPYLYGLDAFDMIDLETLKKSKEQQLIPNQLTNEASETYEFRINRAALRNIAAAVVAIILFFTFSTPIENTATSRVNCAYIIPIEILEQLNNKELPDNQIKSSLGKKATHSQESIIKVPNINRPIVVKEIKAKPASEGNISTPIKHPFFIIVAASIREQAAQSRVTQLKKNGYTKAEILNNEGKIRVSILSCASYNEASRELTNLKQNETYNSAWILRQ